MNDIREALAVAIFAGSVGIVDCMENDYIMLDLSKGDMVELDVQNRALCTFHDGCCEHEYQF